MNVTFEVLTRTDLQNKMRIYAGSLQRLGKFPDSEFWKTRAQNCKNEISTCQALLDTGMNEFYMKDGKIYELHEIECLTK